MIWLFSHPSTGVKPAVGEPGAAQELMENAA